VVDAAIEPGSNGGREHVSFLRATGATGTKEAEKIRSHRSLDR